MEEPEFYLTCRHGNLGSNVNFHNANGSGYGTDLNKLHVYTLAEAQRSLDQDIKSIPLLKSAVDAKAKVAIDHQYLANTVERDPSDQYLIQVSGQWDGNDIQFIAKGSRSFDYSQAKVFSSAEARKFMDGYSNYVLWPKTYMDTLTRRTFRVEDINVRTMVTGTGIKYKKPRKPRPTTGKTRGHCAKCSHIFWDFNPYEEFCSTQCANDFI